MAKQVLISYIAEPIRATDNSGQTPNRLSGERVAVGHCVMKEVEQTPPCRGVQIYLNINFHTKLCQLMMRSSHCDHGNCGSE